MSNRVRKHEFGHPDSKYDAKEELSWMNYSGLLDMDVEFSADLGETELTVRELLKLTKGSIIDLKKPAGESVESYVNGRILGKGEVMVYEKILLFVLMKSLIQALYYTTFQKKKHD